MATAQTMQAAVIARKPGPASVQQAIRSGKSHFYNAANYSASVVQARQQLLNCSDFPTSRRIFHS